MKFNTIVKLFTALAAAVGAIPAPVTASVGQTIRVSAVDENGQPTEWEAVDMTSGDESELPLIQEYTIEEEDVNTIEFTDLQNLTEFELFVSWNWQTVTGTSNVRFSLHGDSKYALNLYNALIRGIDGGIWIQGRPVSKSKPEWIRFLGSFVCYNNSNSGVSTVQVKPTEGIVTMRLYTVTNTVYFPVGTVVTLRGK